MRITPLVLLLALVLGIAPVLALGSQNDADADGVVLAESESGEADAVQGKPTDPPQSMTPRTTRTSVPRTRLRWQSLVPGMIK